MGAIVRFKMKVFIVGNVAIDETFAVNRIPCEGESIFGTRVTTDLGGKGANQAIVFARSGVTAVLIAATGTDTKADMIRSFLIEEPVITRLIDIADKTSDSSIILKDGRGGNAIVTTVDCARSLDAEEITLRMTDANSGDLLVLQGNTNLATTKYLITKSLERDMQVILNPSPFEIGIEALMINVNTIFLNEHEAFQITGCQNNNAVKKLLEIGVETVVLSKGEKGLLLGTKAGIFTVPAHPCEVIDSTGAGDTLLAVALAASIFHKSNIGLRSLEIAAKAASLTVSRSGTLKAFPTKEELGHLIKGVNIT